jgi:hypothetical protein
MKTKARTLQRCWVTHSINHYRQIGWTEIRGWIETKFQHLEDEDDLWRLDFDGAVGKDGAGIGT